MWPFTRKKLKTELNALDSQLVNTFPKRVDLLIEMTEDHSIKQELNILKSKIEFLSVSPKKDVLKVDEKIIAKLDDLKILLVKNKSIDEVIYYIKDVRALIEERAIKYSS